MDEIHRQVRKALDEYRSIRVLFACRTKMLNPSDLVGSVSVLIKDFVEAWKDDANIRSLVVSAYLEHTYCVLDFNNNTYDYNTAHVQMAILPLYFLRLSRRGNWTIFRYTPGDRSIAEEIRMLHNFKGWVPLPLLDDHTKGPVIDIAPRLLLPPFSGTENEPRGRPTEDSPKKSAGNSTVGEEASAGFET